MKKSCYAILVSLLFHAALLWLVSRILPPFESSGSSLILRLDAGPAGINSDKPTPETGRAMSQPAENPVKVQTSAETSFSPLQPSPPSPPLHPYENLLLEREKRKQTFLSAESEDDPQDSLYRERIQALLREQPEAIIAHRPADEVSEMIEKRTRGSNPAMISTENLFSVPEGRQTERHPPRFDFLPTRIQLLTMAYLYKNRSADQIELYSRLPIDEPISAEGLNRSLDELVIKGLLTRKKVSPQQWFNLFGVPIEMSAQNRRNKVFEYAPSVDRQKLMAYLQSRLFLLRDTRRSSTADTTALNTRIKDLEGKIRILVKE